MSAATAANGDGVGEGTAICIGVTTGGVTQVGDFGARSDVFIFRSGDISDVGIVVIDIANVDGDAGCIRRPAISCGGGDGERV